MGSNRVPFWLCMWCAFGIHVRLEKSMRTNKMTIIAMKMKRERIVSISFTTSLENCYSRYMMPLKINHATMDECCRGNITFRAYDVDLKRASPDGNYEETKNWKWTTWLWMVRFDPLAHYKHTTSKSNALDCTGIKRKHKFYDCFSYGATLLFTVDRMQTKFCK